MTEQAPYPQRAFHSDPCPGCGHALGIHVLSLGCAHGWVSDGYGGTTAEGCKCPLTLAGQHRPPLERDV